MSVPLDTYVQIVAAGEPHTRESVEMLCLSCTLAECDEKSPLCLIQIARRRDKRLNDLMYYYEWLANGDGWKLAHRAELKRAAARRYAAKKSAQKKAVRK